MSSTSTTWTTDTNTKSGTVQVYESNVSVLRITGVEDGDAVLELFSDQGDDNADKWRMWINDADNDLHFTSYTSGSWVDKLTIQDGGNVGIGTNSPSSVLDILSTSTQLRLSYDSANYATFAIAADGLLNIVTVDPDGAEADICLNPDGNVGIGTTSPDTLLHLSGEDTAILRLENTDASLEANQLIGAVEWEKVDSSGAGAGVVGSIDMRSTDSTGTGAYMDFHVGSSSGNNAFAMRIDALGNVGIGTTSPSVPLEVFKHQGHDDKDTIIQLNCGSSTGSSGLSIDWTDDEAGVFASILGHTAGPDPEKGTLQFIVSNKAAGSQTAADMYTGTNAVKMVLDEDGMVGIGTASPGTILDIDSGASGESSAEASGIRITGQRNGSIQALTMRHEDASGGNTDADEGIGMHFQGYDGSNSYHNMGAIYVRSAETSVSDSDSPGYMSFFTTSNASDTLTERMRIDKDGNVGIGVTPTANMVGLSIEAG